MDVTIESLPIHAWRFKVKQHEVKVNNSRQNTDLTSMRTIKQLNDMPEIFGRCGILLLLG